MPATTTLTRLPWRHRAVLALLPGHVRHEHERELALSITEDEGRLGWTGLLLDVVRAAPRAHWDVMRQDLRVALRQLHRSPAFVLVAVVTLSLGLGGNLAFFTLVDGVLFRPLRLLDSRGLVSLTEENLPRGMRTFGMSPANFLDYARDSSLFRSATAWQVRSGTLRAGETHDRVLAASVSGEFFRVFLERAAIGRTLEPSDDVVGSDAVVASHAFHQNVLGGDPGVIGREVEVDGQKLRIVGVMPPGFAYPSGAVALWRPLAMGADQWQRRGARFVSAVARLREGATVAQAQARLRLVAASLAQAHPETNRDWTVLVRDLREARVEGVRPQLYLAWAAGALVLLVALANVAGLFSARALTRQREFAVRTALGARAGRVARQVTTEALLLTGIAALAGLGIAAAVLAWVRASGAGAIPRIDEVSLGWRAVALGGVLAIAAALAIGVVTVSATRTRDPWRALGSARGGASRARWRLHRALVAGEVAFASFVLIGAALVGRTLFGLLDEPMGFDAAQVTTFRVEPPFRLPPGLPDDRLVTELAADRQRVAEGYAALRDAIRALPGVVEVGGINRLPLTGEWWVTSVRLPDRPATSDEAKQRTWVRPVTPGYLEAMRTRIRRGRAIEPTDAAGVERVVVIDEVLARHAWGTEDPLGRELLLDGPPGQDHRARVVGVAEAVHMNRLDAEHVGTMYVPFAQATEGFFPNWGMDLVVRVAGAPARVEDIRRLARGAFPDAVVFNIATMESVVRASVADRRFQLLVLGLFAALALVLATVGVGGALVLVVRERSQELALRIALGARLRRVWWQVQGAGLAVVAVGAVLGTVSALAGARVFSSLVYGIPVRDPVAFILAPLVLCLAAFVAVAIPATRATRMSPTAALRES